MVKKFFATFALFMGVSVLMSSAAGAQTGEEVQFIVNNLWVFIAGILVMFMQAGFALVEAGLTRSKNVANIMAKNLSDGLIGVLAFWAIGYAIAYGGDGSLFGTQGMFLNGIDMFGGETLTGATDFFFQSVFAATAVTIASGAMAERTKFSTYLVFSAIMTGLIYPLVVHWTWGGGFIANMSIGDAVYSDFAGSTIVHSVGGWSALMGAIFLGPRIGKYVKGKPVAIPGHSVPFAIVGVLILMFGWFGFNGGSELAADTAVMAIALNTLLAAAGGGVAASVTVWVTSGKPDVLMAGNGVLAGLVSITAGCGAFTPNVSVLVGLIGGTLVVFAVNLIERAGVDDPVGAVAVHGVCGVWGTLAIGLFAKYDDAFLGRTNAGLFYGGGFDQLAMQAVFVVIVAAFTVTVSSALFFALKYTMGLRVSVEEEIEGLDILEHGVPGYSFS